MAHTAKVREIKNIMLKIFGPNCWMGYKVERKNKFTYHHICEQRSGGKDTIENGAILTGFAHCDLNVLDLSVKELYREFNLLFIHLNRTNKPPTIEYYKELQSLLIEAKKYIEISKNCILTRDFDFDLLKKMIEKAKELDNTKGHIELLEEYYKKVIGSSVYEYEIEEGYIKIDGIYIPVSYENESSIEITGLNDYSNTVSKLELKKLMAKRKNITPIFIEEEYSKSLRHKNRRNIEYKIKK